MMDRLIIRYIISSVGYWIAAAGMIYLIVIASGMTPSGRAWSIAGWVIAGLFITFFNYQGIQRQRQKRG